MRYAIPDRSGTDITEGNRYAVKSSVGDDLHIIVDDRGDVIVIREDDCAHLNLKGSWKIVEDDSHD